MSEFKITTKEKSQYCNMSDAELHEAMKNNSQDWEKIGGELLCRAWEDAFMVTILESMERKDMPEEDAVAVDKYLKELKAQYV